MSVNDSHSAYQPSINVPVMFDESDSFEKDLHAFLDAAGIFQINVKQQLECEKKSTTVCHSEERISFFSKRKSPSLYERRQRLFQS